MSGKSVIVHIINWFDKTDTKSRFPSRLGDNGTESRVVGDTNQLAYDALDPFPLIFI